MFSRKVQNDTDASGSRKITHMRHCLFVDKDKEEGEQDLKTGSRV